MERPTKRGHPDAQHGHKELLSADHAGQQAVLLAHSMDCLLHGPSLPRSTEALVLLHGKGQAYLRLRN